MSWAVTCNSQEFAAALARLGTRPDLFCSAGIGALEDLRACFDHSGELIPGSDRTGSSRYASDGTRLPCPPENLVSNAPRREFSSRRAVHIPLHCRGVAAKPQKITHDSP